MQNSLFDKTPTEVKTPKALTIQDMFGLTRQGWLEECRKTAKQLLRFQDSVTVEDILPLVPRPEYIHRNSTGSIFDGQFRSVGWVQSKRPISKGRWIMQWKLKNAR